MPQTFPSFVNRPIYIQNLKQESLPSWTYLFDCSPVLYRKALSVLRRSSLIISCWSKDKIRFIYKITTVDYLFITRSLGAWKITLLISGFSLYQGKKSSKLNIVWLLGPAGNWPRYKSGFCYIRPRYNEVYIILYHEYKRLQVLFFTEIWCEYQCCVTRVGTQIRVHFLMTRTRTQKSWLGTCRVMPECKQ